ncbi:MAG: polymorphic toxin-type HINT domain-containing protein [Acidobacteriota bacterium]|nr:polymorphic toxin-type HINT domain-containing protein [Acidobacteriota bacterium]
MSKRLGLMTLMLFLMGAPAWAQGGNEPPTARRYVTGQVLTDADSRPAAGISVSLSSPNQSLQATTDADGRYQAYVVGYPIDVKIEAAGYIAMHRRLENPNGAWRVPDFRLTPRNAAATSPYTLATGTVTTGGGLAGSAQVTAFSGQALPALLPMGYAPLYGIEVSGSIGTGSLIIEGSLPLSLPMNHPVLLLRRQENNWTVVAGDTLSGDQFNVSYLSTGDGIYLIAARDSFAGGTAPVAGDTLTETAPAQVPGSALSAAGAVPASVSIIEEPQTSVLFQAQGGANLLSGSRVRIGVTETHRYFESDDAVREYAMDLHVYGYGQTTLTGSMNVHSRIDVNIDTTESARLNFAARNEQPLNLEIPVDGRYVAGPMTFDFSEAMTDPVAMRIGAVTPNIPGLRGVGSVVAGFEWELGGTLSGNPRLAYRGGDHAAMVLLRQGANRRWFDVGALTKVGRVWRNDPARSDLMSAGKYALVAVNNPLSEIEGVVSAAMVPRAGIHVKTDLVPWYGLTGAAGTYIYHVPQISQTFNATDPVTLERGTRTVDASTALPLITGQDISLAAPNFVLVNHSPKADAPFVPLLPKITLEFNLPLTYDRTILENAVSLTGPTGAVGLRVLRTDTGLLVLPQVALTADSDYTFSVAATMTSLVGGNLTTPASFNFHTRTEADNADLDLTRFLLELEAGQLYVTAASDLYPDRTRLSILNESNASSLDVQMRTTADFRQAVDGQAGDQFLLEAVTPDGETYSHVIQTVKTAPDTYKLGATAFTVPVGAGLLRVDDIQDGVGREIKIETVPAQTIEDMASSNIAFEDAPPLTTHYSLVIESLDGGDVPSFEGRIEMGIDNVSEDALVNLFMFGEQTMPAAPGSQEMQTFIAARVSDSRIAADAVAAPAKTRASGKFTLTLMMMEVTSQILSANRLFFGLISTSTQQASFNRFNVRTVRDDNVNVPWPDTPKPNWNVSEYYETSRSWIHAPYIPFWYNASPGAAGGHIPGGITDKHGEAKGVFRYAPIATVTSTDPLTGQTVKGRLAFLHRALDPLGRALGFTGMQYVRFTKMPEGTPPESAVEFEWEVGTVTPITNYFQKSTTLSEEANEEKTVPMDADLRLRARIEVSSDSQIDLVELSGSYSTLDDVTIKQNSAVVMLPASILTIARPLQFTFTVTKDGNPLDIKRRLLVTDDQVDPDVEGAPFVLSGPKGLDIPVNEPLVVRMSEPVNNWLAGMRLKTGLDNTVDVSVWNEQGLELVNTDYSSLVYIQPKETLSFNTDYTLEITNVKDQSLNVINEGTPEEPETYETMFRTRDLPENVTNLLNNDWSHFTATWYHNLLLVAQTHQYLHEDTFYLFDYRNPDDPRLVWQYRVNMPDTINPRIALFTPDNLADDDVSLAPPSHSALVDNIPVNSIITYVGLNGAYTQLSLLSFRGEAFKDEEIDRLGTMNISENGFIRDLVQYGSYLGLCFYDFELNGGVVFYDLRTIMNLHRNRNPYYAEPYEDISWMDYVGNINLTNPSTRYPTPRKPYDTTAFFRTDEDGFLAPTLLISGRDFPGIYPFEPGTRQNYQSTYFYPDLPQVDTRFLAPTAYPTASPSRGRFNGAVTDLNWFDRDLNGYRVDDFAVFSAHDFSGGSNGTGYISIYKVPEVKQSPAPIYEAIVVIELPDGLQNMAVDDYSGIIAVQDRENRLSFLDLAAVLEEYKGTTATLPIDHDFFLISEPMPGHFNNQMNFHRGFLYGTSVRGNTFMTLPVAPELFRPIVVDIDADSNMDGVWDETDDEIEEWAPGRALQHPPLVPYEDEFGCIASEAEQLEDAQVDPIEIRLDAIANEELQGSLVLDVEQGADLITVEDAAGQPVTLPAGYNLGSVPEKLFVKGVAPGTVLLKFSFMGYGGQEIAKDLLRLNVTRYVEGPGVVSGTGYIREYFYSLPEEPTAEMPEACTEVKRFLGFDLNRPATVTFEFDDEKLLDRVDLKPGRYEYPVEMNPIGKSKRNWTFLAELSGGDGLIEETGFVEIVKEQQQRIGIGSTSVKGVNLTSGALTMGAQDIAVPGFGPGLGFSRFYASTAARDYNPLGTGWNHNFQSRMVLRDCQTVQVIGGDGSGQVFFQGTGEPAMPGVHSRIEPNAYEGYTLVLKSGKRYVYGKPLAADPAGAFTPTLFKQNLLFIEDVHGNRLTLEYYEPQEDSDTDVESESEYDEDNNQIASVTDDAGRKIIFRYIRNDSGYLHLVRLETANVTPAIYVAYEYDEHERLIKASRVDMSGLELKSESYGYSFACEGIGFRDKIVSYTNPNGNTTSYTYHDATTLGDKDAPQNYVASIIEPEGRTTHFDYGIDGETRTATVSDSIAVTTYTFNSGGQPTRVVGPLGTRTMVWSPDDLLLEEETDEAGRTFTYTYDLMGNRIGKEQQGTSYTESWTFDQTWNRPVSHTDANGNITTWTLDMSTGVVLSMNDPNGNTISFSYDDKGNMTGRTDGLNRTTTVTYDSYGYVSTITSPDNNISTRVYDSRGRMLSESNSTGASFTIVYDDLDRVLSRTTGGTGAQDIVVSYTGYKPMGQPGTAMRGDLTVTYQYDALNRVVKQINDPGAGSPTVTYDMAYDAHNNVISRTESGSPGGTRTNLFTYDAADRLISEDRNGQTVARVTYVPGTQIMASFTDRRGSVTNYTYDAFLHLDTVTLPTGHVQDLDFDLTGNLLVQRDANGNATTYTYDAGDRVKAVENALAHKTNITYDAANNVLTQANTTTGAAYAFTYDNMNRMTSHQAYNKDLAGADRTQTKNFTYGNFGLTRTTDLPLDHNIVETSNSLGQLVSRTQNGIETGYTYDHMGHLTQIDHPEGYTTRYFYDGFGRKIREELPHGYVQTWSYDIHDRIVSHTDARGVTVTTSYDDFDRPLVRTYQQGATSLTESWTYLESGGSLTETHTDTRGNKSTRIYDGLDRLVSYSDETRGGTASITWDGVNRVSMTDLRGFTTSIAYDDLNRPTSVTDDGGAVSIAYDDNNLTTTYTDKRGLISTRVTDIMGNVLQQTRSNVALQSAAYDLQNRLASVTDADNVTTSFTYDGFGRLTSQNLGNQTVTLGNYDDLGRPRSHNDGRVQTTYSYDYYGRMLSRTNGLNETVSYTYDPAGNITSRTAPSPNTGSATWNYTYDIRNSLTSVTEPTGALTTFDWTQNWGKLTLTDAENQQSIWLYDNADRLTSLSIPGLGTTSFTYDAGDNRLTMTRPIGSVTYTYDYRNLPTLETWSGNPDPALAVTSISRQYDGNGNMTGVTQMGSEGTYTRSVTYDNLDRPTVFSDNRNLSYTIGYNDNGTRSSITNSAGMTVNYSYDTANRLAGVDLGIHGTASYTYLTNGLLDTVSFSNGVSSQYGYDGANRGNSLVHTRADAKQTNYAAEYYGDGSRRRLTETRPDGKVWQTDYSYDDASRLTSFTRATPDHTRTTALTLDLVGNRLSESETGTGYDRQRSYTYLTGHRLAGFSETIDIDGTVTSDRDVAYSYDLNGNRTAKVETNNLTSATSRVDMFWDAKNRLRRMDIDSNPSLYMDYDDLDRRIRKIGDTRGDMHYVWDQLSVLEEFEELPDGSLSQEAAYAFGLAQLAMVRPDGNARFFHQDLLGSVADITDHQGNLFEAKTYTPFGKPEAVFIAPTGGYNRFGFTGHEYDPETNLTYAKARFYDPDVGIFASTDPEMGDFNQPPSLHRYMYGNANPLLYTDPDGRKSAGEWIETGVQWLKDNGHEELAVAAEVGGVLWDVLGFEEVTKVIDRVASGNTEDLTGMDWFMATLDVVTFFPVAGVFAKVTKIGIKGTKAIRKTQRVADGLDTASDVGKGLDTARDAGKSLDNAADAGDAAADIGKGVDKPTDIVPSSGKIDAKPKPETPPKTKPQGKVNVESRNKAGTRSGPKAGGPAKPNKAKGETLESKAGKGESLREIDGITKARNAKGRDAKKQVLKEHGFDESRADELLRNGLVCFVAGTQVLTDRGLKNIEDVETGDRVLSIPEEGGDPVYREVTDTFITNPDTLYHVIYRTEEGEDELVTTMEHPFFVTNEGNWIRAADLQPGDTLYLANGKLAEMVRLEIERGPPASTFTTYNFTVAGTHTYFVLPEGRTDHDLAVWVHNTSSKYCSSELSPENALRYERYLKTKSPNTPVKSPEEWMEMAEKLWARNTRGNAFEKAVRQNLGTKIGKGSKPVNIDGYIPDLPVGGKFGVGEIKDVQNLTLTKQLSSFINYAKQNDLQFTLIISERTQSISRPLLDAIRDLDGLGQVWRYTRDGKFKDIIEIGSAGRWKAAKK